MANKTQDQPASFNMGISTLKRINYFLWQANKASSQDDIVSWYKSINTLYKELYPFIRKDADAKQDLKDIKKDVEEEYEKYLNWHNKKPHNRDNPNPPRKIFNELEEWELEIRELLDEKELLMKKDPDPTKALLG